MTAAEAPELEPSGPMVGVRVIECGSLLAGPFCGQLLGDFGAEVIKVEDPGQGDPMRQWGQKVKGLSLHWPIVARNKKSVTIDLRQSEGQGLLRRLAARADVVLENFRPGTFERWGLGFDVLSESNPGLVLTRVSGYGQDGPYAPRAGFGSIGEAMGGVRALTGEPDRPPARVGNSLAATFAALGTVMALRARDRSGRGQVVDSAIYEAVLAFMESVLPEWELAGYQRQRTGSVLPGVAPSNAYPTADGQEVLIGANRDTVFARLAKAMGRPELAEDPRFATHDARGARQVELDDIVAAWTAGLGSDAVLAELHGRRARRTGLPEPGHAVRRALRGAPSHPPAQPPGAGRVSPPSTSSSAVGDARAGPLARPRAGSPQRGGLGGPARVVRRGDSTAPCWRCRVRRRD